MSTIGVLCPFMPTASRRVVVALILLAVVLAVPAEGRSPLAVKLKELHGCQPAEVPKEERCAYVRAHPSCRPEDGWIPYLEVHYCYLDQMEAASTAVFLLWIAVLFLLMLVVAERFFCPSLELISEYLRLPPCVAGATLLSFGNGAPDVFTQLAAISAGDSDSSSPGAIAMALSEPLGSGLFVGNIVFGLVVLFSGLSEVVVEKWYFLKDCLFYLGGVAIVFGFLLRGVVMVWEVALLAAYYVAFILTTILLSRGDEPVHADPRLHEVPHRLRPADSFMRESFRRLPEWGSDASDTEANMPLLAGTHTSRKSLSGLATIQEATPPGSPPPELAARSLPSWISNPDLDPDLDPAEVRRQRLEEAAAAAAAAAVSATSAAAAAGGGTAVSPNNGSAASAVAAAAPPSPPLPTVFAHGSDGHRPYRLNSDSGGGSGAGFGGRTLSDSRPPAAASGGSANLKRCGSAPSRAAASAASAAAADDASARRSSWWGWGHSDGGAAADNQHCSDCPALWPSPGRGGTERASSMRRQDSGRPPGPMQRFWRRLEKPGLTLLSLFMPRVAIDTHARYRKTTAVLLPPLLPTLWGWTQGWLEPAAAPGGFWRQRWWQAATGVGLLVALAAVVYYPRKGHLHGYAAGIATVVVFCEAMFLLDTSAGELVSTAVALGQIYGISPSLLGATLLAWGNSVSDLVSNITLAMDGLPSMAITACFASPMFVLLAGLVTSLTYATRHGDMQLPGDLALRVLYGCSSAILLMWALVVPLAFRFRLSRRVGVLAVTVYLAYQVVYIWAVVHDSRGKG